MDETEQILNALAGSNANAEESQVAPEETTATPQTEEKEQVTIESLESLSEKSDDAVPLKKFMAEKNAKRDAENRAKELEKELAQLRSNPTKTSDEINYDVSSLSEKHGIDAEVLSDILNASYSMTKERVKQELEQEFNPKLAELESIKKEKAINTFEDTFNKQLSQSLETMPEYANLVDKDDLKDWIKSGKYSKFTLPQLIEEKYSKFVAGKKTTESYTPSKEVSQVDVYNIQEEDWAKINTDPSLKKKYSDSFAERMSRLH